MELLNAVLLELLYKTRFSNNLNFLTHCVVTLVGYVGTKNEEGWYFGTLSNWAFYMSNQSDVSNSGRHRRRHRRQRHCGRRLQRNKTKQATGSTRCDCTPWGPFFNYVDHFFLLLSIYLPLVYIAKEYLHCYWHFQYHLFSIYLSTFSCQRS